MYGENEMFNKIKLFEDLSQEEIAQVRTYFKTTSFQKKQSVRFSGASQDYIYLVGSGRVKVSYLSPEGREIIVTILNSGDIYSLHSEARTTVLEPAEVWYISSDDFKKIIMENPSLTINLIKILGTILKNTNDALLNLAFKEVNSRLATLLCKMASEKGRPTGEGVALELGLTHEEIASLISSTRQTVTTILNRFEKAGLIRVYKKTIIIKRWDELAELSQ